MHSATLFCAQCHAHDYGYNLGGAGRGAGEADVKGAQVFDGLGRRHWRHACGEAEQDPGTEAGPGGSGFGAAGGLNATANMTLEDFEKAADLPL